MKWIGQHIYDLTARFRSDVTIEGDLTVNGTYTQIDTDVTTTEQWLVTNDGTGPAAIINQKGSQDIFDVQDDGTSVFYIEDGGNVGIGTTSPGFALDIKTSTSDDGISLSATSGRKGIEMLLDNGTNGGGDIKMYTGSSVLTNRITAQGSSFINGGNVGIGTSSPSELLHVSSGAATHAKILIDAGADADLILDKGAGSRRSHIDYKVAGTTKWYAGTADSDVVGDGDDYYVGTTVGGTNAEFFLKRSNGNVGIGTTSPDDILHVLKDQGGVASALKLENKAGANNSGFDIDFQLASSGLSAKIGAIRTNSPGAGDTDMFFSTSTNGTTATEAMRITHDGNVGIGTTSPAYTLDVAGVINTNSNYRQGGVKILGRESSNTVLEAGGDNDIVFETNNAEKVRVLSSGNVGIGTTSPSEVLDVVGNIKTTGIAKFYNSTSHYGSINADSEGLTLDTVANRHMRFKKAGVEVMRINTSGNVGIGTTAPQDKLSVSSGSSTSRFSIINTGGGKSIIQAGIAGVSNNGTTFSTANADGSSENVRMVISAGGNVGIGTTSPQKTLDVAGGDIRLDNSKGIHFSTVDANIGRVSITGDESNDFIRLKVDNSNSHIINLNTTGVGIGTTSPASKLHVEGAVQIGVNDAGHDFTLYGDTANYNMMWDASSSRLEANDNVKFNFGTGNDLSIYHTGSHSNIQASGTGDLKITQTTDDQDIIFQCDDGSGGTTPYLTLDGSSKRNIFSENVVIANKYLYFGTYLNAHIRHDGSNLTLANTAGNITFTQNTDDGDIIFQSDDGSGGLTTYFYLDGGSAVGSGDSGLKSTIFPDGSLVSFGNDGDLSLSHYQASSSINNSTGNLTIKNSADDKDIIFQSDDGSGGVETYFSLDGSLADGSNNYTKWPDNSIAAFGSAPDLFIYHDGTNSRIRQSTASDLIIENLGDDKDIIFKCDDGSGGLATYLQIDGGSTRTRAFKDINFDDNVKATYGAGSDLQVFHNATDSYALNGTGNFYIANNADDKDLILQCDDGSGSTTAYLTLDGSEARTNVHKNMLFDDSVTLGIGASYDLQLYHNGSTSLISNQNGNLLIRNQADDGDIIIQADNGSGGDATYMTFDGGIASILTYRDILMANDGNDGKIKFGASQDLSIYHDGSNSYIDQTGTGNLIIRNTTDDADIIFQSDDGSGGVETYFFLDGSSGGANPMTIFPDDSRLSMGTGVDLHFKHNGTNSYIENETGDLYITQDADDKDIILRSDDGSGGTTAYLTLDGSETKTIVSQTMEFQDNVKLAIGNSEDMTIDHNATDTRIMNYTGDLRILNAANDKDITFESDDGAGGVTPYLTLDGTAGHTVANKEIHFLDNVLARFGSTNDFAITHNGTNTTFENGTGNLVLSNYADDADIIFQSDDGSGGVTTYFQLDGGEGRTVFKQNALWEDSKAIYMGNGADLRLYHNGSNSFIESHTGNLTIDSAADDADIIFKGTDGGADITALTLDMSAAGQANFNSSISIPDAGLAYFGTGNDLQINHDGSNSYINHVGTGHMYIQNTTDDKDIILRSDDGSGSVTPYLTLDGGLGYITVQKRMQLQNSVGLYLGTSTGDLIYHNGSNTFWTHQVGDLTIESNQDDGDIIFKNDNGSGGTTAYLTLDGGSNRIEVAKNMRLADNVSLLVGGSSDLYLKHDGSNSYISQGGTGNLYIQQNTADADLVLQCDDGSGGTTAYLTLDGSAGTIEIAKDTNVSGNVTATRFISNIIREGNGNGHLVTTVTNASNTTTVVGNNATCNTLTLGAKSGGSVTTQANVSITGTLTVGVDDTGHDVKFFGATSGEYILWDESEDALRFTDNTQLRLGIGNDLRLWHNGTNSYVFNYTGNLYVGAGEADKDTVFLGDNGSGGEATYLTLDGSAGHTTVQKEMNFEDSVRATFGNLAGGDMAIYHDGTNNYHNHYTGDVYFRNNADDKDIIFQCDDGSGGVTAYLTLDGSAGTIEVAKTINSTAPITSASTITADTYFASSDAAVVLAPASAGSCYLRPNGVGSGTGAFSVSAAGKATVSGELEATSLDINGNADISGNITTATWAGATIAAEKIATLNQDTTGSAATLTEPRAINGVDFDGSTDITVTAAAGTLTGSTLKSTVLASSLTSVGAISSGSWRGTPIASTYIADNAINSQHYADGSIDTAHIADDQVTFAKASGVTPNVYDNIIKILPSDFVANDDAGTAKVGIAYKAVSGSTYGMKPNAADTELFALVPIPQGMMATHVDVFAKTNLGVIVYEAQTNANTMVSKGTGNCNTQIDITDVNSTATNFLAIEVTTTATSDRVFGGQVTIAAI